MACGVNEYRRFEIIDQYFSSGKRATVKELYNYIDDLTLDPKMKIDFGYSEKNLYKVLEAMRDELGMPLVTDADNRYYYSSSVTLTKPGFLNREETGKTIRLINNLLETIKDSPIYEEAAKLCKDITNEAPLFDQYGKVMKKDAESTSASSRVIFMGAPASDMREAIWSDIFKAMENNYPIVIKYISPGYTQTISRGINPYQLIFDDGIWDLWGFDLVKKKAQLYNLSRIKSVVIRKDAERFTFDPKDDFLNITPGTFGCYRDINEPGMTTYKIRLKKGSYAESYASERVWGMNSSISQDDKGTVIQFDDNQYLPILRWVLGWGPEAEPLEPQKLVDDWKKKIKEMEGMI